MSSGTGCHSAEESLLLPVDDAGVSATDAAAAAADGDLGISGDAGLDLDAGDPADVGVEPEPCEPLPTYDPEARSPRFAVGTTTYDGLEVTVPLVTGDPSSPPQALEVAAVVYYPAETSGRDAPAAAGGSFPVLLLLHGNHNIHRDARGMAIDCEVSFDGLEMNTLEEVRRRFPGATRVPSHEGHEYLGETLAAAGHVVVSIDGNDTNCINTPTAFIPERARLMAEHLALLARANDGMEPALSAFSALLGGRLDLERVVLAGHSRGGEAALHAQDLALEAGHTPIGVFSVAPTTFLFTARDTMGRAEYRPTFAPLFMVLPSADGDVWYNGGMKYFDGAVPAALSVAGQGGTWFKAQHYVYGANHNFFNTAWTEPVGSCGVARPDGDNGVGNGDDRLGAAAQRNYLTVALLAFMNATAHRDPDARAALAGDAPLRGIDGLTIHPSFSDGRAQVSLANPPIGVGFSELRLAPFTWSRAAYNDTFFHANDGYVGAWQTAGPALTVSMSAPRTLSDVIAFRAAQVEDVLNLPERDLVVEVVLEDESGRRRSARSDWHGRPLPPWYARPPWQNPGDGCADYPSTKTVLASIRIPSRCFRGDPGFDPSAVRSLHLGFPGRGTGAVAVTEFEIVAP